MYVYILHVCVCVCVCVCVIYDISQYAQRTHTRTRARTHNITDEVRRALDGGEETARHCANFLASAAEHKRAGALAVAEADAVLGVGQMVVVHSLQSGVQVCRL